MSIKKKFVFFGHSPFTKWNILGFIILGMVAASIIISSWFIYEYLFNTLDEANSIVVLKSGPDLDIIDNSSYEKAKIYIANKTPTSSAKIYDRNIFAFSTTTIPGMNNK